MTNWHEAQFRLLLEGKVRESRVQQKLRHTDQMNNQLASNEQPTPHYDFDHSSPVLPAASAINRLNRLRVLSSHRVGRQGAGLSRQCGSRDNQRTSDSQVGLR